MGVDGFMNGGLEVRTRAKSDLEGGAREEHRNGGGREKTKK